MTPKESQSYLKFNRGDINNLQNTPVEKTKCPMTICKAPFFNYNNLYYNKHEWNSYST